MIIDQVPIAGKAAYLLPESALSNPAQAEVNLAPMKTGRSDHLDEGQVLAVEGIQLHLAADDLVPLLRRQERPMLSVTVHKEMFPGLFRNPFAHRVHFIGGHEDLNRGQMVAMRCMEVNGAATLVSTDGDMSYWTSAVYRLPVPVNLEAAAWDLAATKLTPADGFRYSLALECWTNTHAGESDVIKIVLIENGTPVDDRLHESNLLRSRARGIRAYRLLLAASVSHDTFLRERHTATGSGSSIGQPLLRSVQLLERTVSSHEFHSLQELISAAGEYHLVEQPVGVHRNLRVRLGISAKLAKGEWLSVGIHSPDITYATARMDARMFLRPASVK